MNKKKILIVNNNLAIGGIQKALVNLLQALSNDYDFTLYLFYNNGPLKSQSPENVKIIEASFPLKFLGMSHRESKKYGFFRYLESFFLRAFTKLIGRKHPINYVIKKAEAIKDHYDAAISFMQNPADKNFYGGCNEFVLRKVNADKKITFLHCDYSLYGGNNKNNNEILKKFDKICFVSNSCKDIFINCVKGLVDKTCVVKNFNNIQRINELANIDTVKYDDNFINFLFVGRLSPEKGLLRLINALFKIKQLNYKFRLHVVGGGNIHLYKDFVISKDMECDIIFWGEQSNPYRFMKKADLLIVSSYHEAAPMVINEAEILQLPILSTNTVSAKEMLDGKAAIICENSEEGLFEAIKDYFEHDLKEKLKIKAKNIIYSNEEAYRQFANVLG